MWPDVFYYDRDLRDCVVYASLLFGEEDAQEIGAEMFLLSPAEILRWRGFGGLEPNL